MTTRKPWTYGGENIWPCELNSSGMRWYALTEKSGILRADTKEGMRELIREYVGVRGRGIFLLEINSGGGWFIAQGPMSRREAYRMRKWYRENVTDELPAMRVVPI